MSLEEQYTENATRIMDTWKEYPQDMIEGMVEAVDAAVDSSLQMFDMEVYPTRETNEELYKLCEAAILIMCAYKQEEGIRFDDIQKLTVYMEILNIDINIDRESGIWKAYTKIAYIHRVGLLDFHDKGYEKYALYTMFGTTQRIKEQARKFKGELSDGCLPDQLDNNSNKRGLQ